MRGSGRVYILVGVVKNLRARTFFTPPLTQPPPPPPQFQSRVYASDLNDILVANMFAISSYFSSKAPSTKRRN